MNVNLNVSNEQDPLLTLKTVREILKSPTEKRKLGEICERSDIPSSYGSFKYFPESNYRVEYPQAVIDVVQELLCEYNQEFETLIEANREEGEEDAYRFGCAINERDQSKFTNYFVQVDMRGLPDKFLEIAERLPKKVLKQIIKEGVFEFENSLAMYNHSRGIFSADGLNSEFANRFDTAIDEVRERTGKRVALLAVTKEKYDAMKATEFGKNPEEELTDDEVRKLSGFDRFFGPDEFRKYIDEIGEDNSDYVLYVRSSFPSDELKKPKEGQLLPAPFILTDDRMRRIIKKYAITPNIDNPQANAWDPKIINDTKRYLPMMGMGYEITQYEDLFSSGFQEYLAVRGIELDADTRIRVKPLVQYYGAHWPGTRQFNY